MADRVWHRGYWVTKAKSKKSSPWLVVLGVLVVLWGWGHTKGVPEHETSPHPSASASAHASAHPKK